MSETVKTNRRKLTDVATSAGLDPGDVVEQAVSDGIITGANGFDRRGNDPDWLHLAGSQEDFEVYVERLAVTSR